MKVIWSGFDSNYKMKIWNFSFNIVLALVLGFYINLIVEYLAPSFFFKISGSEYFWKSFQSKSILNFYYNKSSYKWFTLYGWKKEYFTNNFFFTFKKNINNDFDEFFDLKIRRYTGFYTIYKIIK